MNQTKHSDGHAKAVRRIQKAVRGYATRLDLSGLGIDDLSPDAEDLLSGLPQLQVLYLGNNNLTDLPAVLAHLVELRVVYLTGNRLGASEQRRWSALGRLSKLERLALNGNQLTAIPAVIGQLTSLERLHLDNNLITALPASIGQLTRLRQLDLHHNQIAAIAKEIVGLRSLEDLDLNTNKISVLPGELGRLSNLRRLYLHNNEIASIPTELGSLARLEELFLQANRIALIPKTLGNLIALQKLHLQRNHLGALPDALGNLSYLKELCLQENRITELPETLGSLSQLATLYLQSNRLTTIPVGLSRIDSLREIYLHNNHIRSIPAEFQRMRWLSRLLLHGNSELDLPAEVLGPTEEEVRNGKQPKPPTEILAYYFANSAGSRPLNEAKLILVGQGAVGKTSLVRKLTTGAFSLDESTTHGIRITDWRCTLSRHETVAVHIWDFGGQEMMHATHRFFLTTRSLYLLVFDRRLGEHDLQADYWFRMIRTYGGPDAPVIVVLNKQKREPFDVNRGRWLELYGQDLHFVTTDCDDDTSIELLAEEIRKQLAGMKNVKSGFPRQWFTIKDRLAGMRRDFIEYHRYQDLCASEGVSNPDDQHLLAGYLHDLGIALQYRDDPRLRFAYVLKPDWVTGGIYALLHAPAASLGVLTVERARAALDPKKYSDEAMHFLLGLLEKFELSFALNDQERRVLVPQLLPDQQPPSVQEFRPAECLNFSYEYPVVPEGLLPRFIVRTHHLSKGEDRWKSGVILRHRNGSRALVRAELAARQVRAHVTGPPSERRDLLAIIRHNLDVIHGEYNIEVRELVYAREAPETELAVLELQTLRDAGESRRVLVVNGKVLKPEITVLLQDVEESEVMPLRLFLSYSHADAKHVEQLRKGLKVMERNGLIRTWYDREIATGQEWKPTILRELGEADAIICQLSADFLASEFCFRTELGEAIKRQSAGQAVLIAYVLRACGWRRVDQLSRFQLLPRDGKPLRDWRDPDQYWEVITDGIEAALKKLRQDPRLLAKRAQDQRASTVGG